MSATTLTPATTEAKPTVPPPEPTSAASIARSKPNVTATLPTTAGANEPPKPILVPLRSHPVVGHQWLETQTASADDTPIEDGHRASGTQVSRTVPDLLTLRIFAEVFDDLQKQRIATANRMERGGIDPTFMEATMARLEEAEKEARKVMRLCYRATVPQCIRDWQKDTIGIGEHLLARLIGAIGHPVHTTVYEWEGTGAERILVEVGPMERTVSQLWSYCGCGDPARRRRAGMSAEEAAATGNPRAKMLVHLLAEACMKQRTSPYRVVYEEARLTYEDRDWTDGHRHNAALRKTGKEILKGLWIAAHEGAS